MASKHISLMASFTSILVVTRRLSVESSSSVLCVLFCGLLSLIVFKPCSYSIDSISAQLHYPLNSMAEHTNTELISQFTEDAYATVDRICERPSCSIQIRAGEPCLYVATINPGQVGRHVCATCYARYENKRATSRRPKLTGELIGAH
jgi:hypothetical protein